MHSTLNPKQTDPHDLLVIAPDVVRVAPADEELSKLLHQAARYRSDTQTRAASDFPASPTAPPVDTMFRPASVNDVLASGHRWSMARRAARGFIALLLTACIGAAAIAWQSHGDAAKRKIAKLATQLVLISSLPPQKPALAAQPPPPAVQADAANAASPQLAPLAPTVPEAVAPAAAAPSPDSAQLLQSMSRDLASLGQEVEQLKASQEQMSRDIAKASEQNHPRPRISALPPRSAAAPARKPMPPFPPPRAAAAPTSPQAAAPSVPRQPEPQPRTTAAPPAEPELSSVPRPPMPVR
jgi:hypothetical protein